MRNITIRVRAVDFAEQMAAMRTWLDEHTEQIRLLYTPSYDPDANPAERLWRAMRPNAPSIGPFAPLVCC